MESRSLQLLEFPKVLLSLSQFAASEPGRQACRNIQPLTDADRLRVQTELLRQAIAWIGERRFRLESFTSLDGLFAFLNRQESFLEQDGLWAVSHVLQVARTAQEAVREIGTDRFALLQQGGDSLEWPARVWSGLRRCLGGDGNIRDESSPELFSVRQEIRRINQQCTRKVHDFFADRDIAHILQDDFLTISSDRYVLALKTNFKGRLQGIVHDYSQTGETCYFEPMFLVELNNSLQELKREERAEEEKVLRYLTGLIRDERPLLEGVYTWLVELDVLLAKVSLAGKIGGEGLEMTSDVPVRLLGARHPLLALGDGPVVPVDIELEPGQRVLIITGGNAGGKTVALKTLGLIALMALAAIPVPVDEGSSLPFLDKVFVSMGDEQSLEENLSTFTAQIRHFSRVWPLIDHRSLIILDEFGVGTDPSQGAALAQAVVDSLLESGAYVGVATHFPALKAYGLSRDGVRAASVIFDPETKKPLFRLGYDQVGASQALDVAREQGLPEPILARAQEYLYLDGNDSSEVFDRINAVAARKEEELRELARRREVLERKHAKLQERLEKERTVVLSEIKARAQEIVRKWQQDRQSRKESLRNLNALREKIGRFEDEAEPATQAPDLGDLAPGIRVVYGPWAKTGLVRAVDGRKKKVQLDIGSVTLWARVGDLLPEVKGEKREGNVTVRRDLQAPAPSMRLDLRGMRGDEAVAELERFVDRAVLAGRESLEVVHGKGTGALRGAVHEFLKRCPSVQDFVMANADEGGEGVTRITLQ